MGGVITLFFVNLFCFEQINFIFAAPKPGNPQSFFEWDSALQYSIDNDPINRLRNFDKKIKNTEQEKMEELMESEASRDYRNKFNEELNKSDQDAINTYQKYIDSATSPEDKKFWEEMMEIRKTSPEMPFYPKIEPEKLQDPPKERGAENQDSNKGFKGLADEVDDMACKSKKGPCKKIDPPNKLAELQDKITGKKYWVDVPENQPNLKKKQGVQLKDLKPDNDPTLYTKFDNTRIKKKGYIIERVPKDVTKLRNPEQKATKILKAA